MIDDYEINEKTLAVLPISETISKVLEEEAIYFVNKKTTEIVDYSCKCFGSSYLGRFEGTKHILGFNYKAPIIIEETSCMIFFPTASPRFDNCTWISLHQIRDYDRDEERSIITFRCGKKLAVEMSYSSLENQILRATRLQSILKEKIYIKK